MGVSDTHVNLVRALGIWVMQNCHPSESAVMLLDLPETLSGNHPPAIGGHIPDMYISSSRMILGEAKTAGDIETKHSRQQYVEYLKHLSQYQESIFILAVPWDCVPLTKSLIKRIQKDADTKHVQTVFLEQLPG